MNGSLYLGPGTQVPLAVCPHCGDGLDGAGEVGGGAKPSAGDFSICAHCAGLVCFSHDMSLRRPTLEDYEELFADTMTCARLLTFRDVVKTIKGKA